MLYLIDPKAPLTQRCIPLCLTLCKTLCKIKPCYGVDPT